ncbi:MAG: 3-oxo-tetronate kinase [Hyphomicrobiales bacterium]
MTLLLGGIADDFTGGLELASIMVRDGVRTRLLTRFATSEDVDGLEAAVVCLKSRVAPRNVAVKAVEDAYRILAPHRPRQVFQKYCATFDSTPRGNIGPCADRLMQLVGAPFTAFCPAFPAVARTVFQGHLFAFDQLISRSLKRNDPLTPMREPDLVRVLQAQTERRVGLIRHEDLRGGTAAIEARVAWLTEQGISYAISDGADDDDLRRLAAAVIDWPLMTGGSTVCEFYAPLWRERGLTRADTPPTRLPKGRGHGVVLAGSCAERTFEQLEVFGARHPVRMIDPVASVGRVDATAEEALAWAKPLVDRSPIAIAVSSRPEQVAALQKKLGRLAAARLAEEIMGRVAKGLAALGARKFVVAGGETSGAVLEALGVRVLDVGPYEGPGTSRAVTLGDDPMSFYLKPGKLGAIDMLERALQNS